jgi:hypothetical protein
VQRFPVVPVAAVTILMILIGTVILFSGEPRRRVPTKSVTSAQELKPPRSRRTIEIVRPAVMSLPSVPVDEVEPLDRQRLDVLSEVLDMKFTAEDEANLQERHRRSELAKRATPECAEADAYGSDANDAQNAIQSILAEHDRLVAASREACDKAREQMSVLSKDGITGEAGLRDEANERDARTAEIRKSCEDALAALEDPYLLAQREEAYAWYHELVKNKTELRGICDAAVKRATAGVPLPGQIAQ